MNIKTFLFDFDGTLVDSMPYFSAAMLRILDENNISYGSDIIKIITPLGFLGTAEYFRELGVEKSVEEIGILMRDYLYEEYSKNVPAKKNVISMLKKLKDNGFSLNVLTASPHLTLDVCLKRLEMWDLFDNIWSCDDFNTSKSDPEIYKSAAKKLNVPVYEVLFFDDNINADKTAKTAGMKTCGVYDKSSEEYIDDIKSVTDYYINDFSEIDNIL